MLGAKEEKHQVQMISAPLLVDCQKYTLTG